MARIDQDELFSPVDIAIAVVAVALPEISVKGGRSGAYKFLRSFNFNNMIS